MASSLCARAMPKLSSAYAGFEPASGAWQPDVIPASTPAAAFFASYVAARKPCIIDGLLDDPGFSPSAWTLESLQREAGGVSLHIEQRDAQRRTFGTGRKQPMTLKAFLTELERGREDLYLTTQPLPEDASGCPTALFAEPLIAMRKRFPQRPRIAGHLTVSTVNLWLGRAADGSSSNLHHDFHDNIYVLLQGRKRFTVAAPSQVARMYMQGAPLYVHPNGLINYAGCPTRADGALPDDVLLAAQAAVRASKGKNAEDAAARQLREAEGLVAACRKRDATYTPVADGEATEEGAGSSDDEAAAAAGLAFAGDSSDDDAAASGGAADDMWAALTAAAAAPRPAHKGASAGRAKGSGKTAVDRASKPGGAAVGGAGASAAGRNAKSAASAAAAPEHPAPSEGPPVHFSRIDLPALRAALALDDGGAADPSPPVGAKRGRPVSGPGPSPSSSPGAGVPAAPPSIRDVQARAAQVKAKFPLLRDAVMAEFELRAGQMLYLPASWFHEVVSFGAAGTAGVDAGTGESSGKVGGARASGGVHPAPSSACHVALNYWFHPPTTSDFARPYGDDFWATRYDAVAGDSGAAGAAAAVSSSGGKGSGRGGK